MKRPTLLGLHARPGRWTAYCLAALPFIFVIATYLHFSHQRHLENPNDKLLPSASQIHAAVVRYAFTQDARSGKYLFWQDTASSLKRLAIGITASAVLALFIGLNMGMFPGLASGSAGFLTFASMIPPMALLPILFISFGIGELGKIALIFFGTFPLMTRDIYMSVKKLPQQLTTKALTLGATQLAVVYHAILPQIMPRLIESLRLSLGAAWLFLIAAEAIASTDGLGYRIFLVRRYLSMDVIIPYVMWITLLGFSIDFALRLLLRSLFPWYRGE